MVLIAAGLFLFGGVMFGGDTFASTEHLFRTIPALDALGHALRSGQLLEWWDGVGLGAPLAADPDLAALYPVTWLAAMIGPRAIDITIVLHVVAAGAGAAMLSRRLGAGPLGAATAAGALLGAQIVTSAAGFGPAAMALAWAPWIVWAVYRLAVDGPSITRALAVSALVGAQLSTGQFSLAIATAVAAVVLAGSRGGRAAAWTIAACAGGALLAMHVILSAVHAELVGPAPLTEAWTARDALTALWPGRWYIGLPTVCVVTAVVVDSLADWRQRRDTAIASVVGIALIAAGVWWGAASALVGAVVVAAVAGAGVEQLATRGASRLQLGAMIAVAFAAVISANAVGIGASEVASAGVAATLVAGCAGACARVKLRAWAGPLLCAALVGHAVSHARKASPRVDRDAVLARPQALGDLGNGADRDRLARPRLPGDADIDAEPESLVDAAAALAPNIAARFSIGYVPGVGRTVGERMRRVWIAAAPHAERLLDLYSVSYVIVPASVAVPSGMPVAGTTPDGKLAVARNLKRRPRAFVAPKWRWYDDESQLQAALFPPARNTARPIGLSTIRLIGNGPVSKASGPMRAQPCELTIGDDRADLDCEARAAGFAVLLDSHAAGWTATVDGRSAAIERADLLARAVWIEAGNHRIHMEYRAPGLRLGGAVAALAWLNLLVGWLVAVRKQSRSDRAG